MTYTWQSITKNIDIEDLGQKVDRRLDKIKKHLLHFPQDSVHLNISLEKNPKKELYTAGLTLHLPSNVLHAEKSSDNLMTAFDNAADVLVREIKSLKAELRGEDKWERKSRRAVLHESKATRFAGLPSKEEGPQDLPEMLPEMWEQHKSRILFHVKQAVRRAEDSGRIPRGRIVPEDVIHKVEESALSAPETRNENQSYKFWFHLLALQELRKRLEMLGAERREHNYSVALSPESETASYPPSAAREIRRRKFDPPKTPLMDIFGDLVGSADQAQIQQLWDELRTETEIWPEENRAVFELRFLEGFTPAEISVLTRISPERVEEILGSIKECVGGMVAHAGHEVGAAR